MCMEVLAQKYTNFAYDIDEKVNGKDNEWNLLEDFNSVSSIALGSLIGVALTTAGVAFPIMGVLQITFASLLVLQNCVLSPAVKEIEENSMFEAEKGKFSFGLSLANVAIGLRIGVINFLILEMVKKVATNFLPDNAQLISLGSAALLVAIPGITNTVCGLVKGGAIIAAPVCGLVTGGIILAGSIALALASAKAHEVAPPVASDNRD